MKILNTKFVKRYAQYAIRITAILLLLAVISQAGPIRDVYPEGDIKQHRALLIGQVDAGTAQGQVLYWDASNLKWIPSATPAAADRIVFWDNSATAIKFLRPWTNISISGTDLNVDDAFLVNDANDETSGVLTVGGLKTDTIDEKTGAAGVTIDSVLLKDGTVTVGTLTISDGSIDDTDGSIAFGATAFTGVGTIGCGAITSSGASTFNSGSVDADFTVNWNTGTGLFVQGSDGRVGIGTASPEAELHIKDSTGSVELLLQSLATTDATIRIRNGSSSKWTFGNDASNDEFIISTGSILGTPKLTILQNGKVGIGTGANAPNAPLEVKGAKPAGNIGGFQSGMFHVTGSGTAQFSNSVITGHSAYNTNTQLWYLGSTSSGNNDIAFINRQNADMHFYTNNTTKMVIKAAGNVGINTTTPLSKLSINGGLHVGGDSDAGDNNLLVDGTGQFANIGIGTAPLSTVGIIDVQTHTSVYAGYSYAGTIEPATASQIHIAFSLSQAFGNSSEDILLIAGTNNSINHTFDAGYSGAIGELICNRAGINITGNFAGDAMNIGVASLFYGNEWVIFEPGGVDINIANAYGLFLPVITGATDNWSLFCSGGDSYHNGYIAFNQIDKEERIGSATTTTLDLYATDSIELHDATNIGDGTNVLQVSDTGDLSFIGTAGLVYGIMDVPAAAVITVDTSATADPVEARDDGTTSANDGWETGLLNLTTFAVSDLHYITITKAGVYKVIWDMSPATAAGAGTLIHGGITIDSTTFIRDNGEGHAHTFNANDNIQIDGVGVIDCPNGNEEISLWISNNQNQKTVIEHGSMYIEQIGGT